jgi:hypothetical protein
MLFYSIFLRIPSEIWTDILKMLSRGKLTQTISPVCYRLKEISDKNVPNIHRIRNASKFEEELYNQKPEAILHLQYVEANNCLLRKHFKMEGLCIDTRDACTHPILQVFLWSKF